MSRYLTDEELNAIRAAVPKYGGGNYKALIAEVERLRAEVDAERAAVVAWLQTELEYMSAHDLTGGHMHMRGLIAGIERGKHRREEER